MATCSARDHDLYAPHRSWLHAAVRVDVCASGPQANSLNNLAIGCDFERISNNLPCPANNKALRKQTTRADSRGSCISSINICFRSILVWLCRAGSIDHYDQQWFGTSDSDRLLRYINPLAHCISPPALCLAHTTSPGFLVQSSLWTCKRLLSTPCRITIY
jgi:hypothetical protein